MHLFRPVCAALVLLAVARGQDRRAASRPYFFWTTYPGAVVQFDPATDQEVRKIPLKNGMSWGTTLSWDRKRFFVITDTQKKVEVVDIAQGAVTAEHEFVEEGYIIRVRDVREIPGGTHWYVNTERIKKHKDHYSFEPAQYLLYDTVHKKVEKKLKRLPEPIDRGARISPDGTRWHVYNEDGDLCIVDPKTLKEESKIDLHTPLFNGMGYLSLTGEDLNRGLNPKQFVMVCQLTDPVEINRTQWGLVTIDLENKKLAELTEWGPNPGAWGMRIAVRKRVGVAMSGGFGGGGGGPFGGVPDRRMKLQLYDLTNGKKLKEIMEEFRPRRFLSAISPDGDKIYVGGAGSDFAVYDADLKLVKTIEFDGEIQGQIFVVDA